LAKILLKFNKVFLNLEVNIYFNIPVVKALVKYYYRLINIQSDFPVLHDASEESKILSHSNKPSWYVNLVSAELMFLQT
jgi:hypothetical protein